MRNKFNMLGNLMGEPEDDNDQVIDLIINQLFTTMSFLDMFFKIDQLSNLSMFYEQLLRTQISKSQKKT